MYQFFLFYLLSVSICGIVCTLSLNLLRKSVGVFCEYIKQHYPYELNIHKTTDVFYDKIDLYKDNIFLNVIIPIFNILSTISLIYFSISLYKDISSLFEDIQVQGKCIETFVDEIIQEFSEDELKNDELLNEFIDSLLEQVVTNQGLDDLKQEEIKSKLKNSIIFSIKKRIQ